MSPELVLSFDVYLRLIEIYEIGIFLCMINWT